MRPPRIKECPVQLECRVEHVGECSDRWLVVRGLAEHVERLNFSHYSGTRFFKVGEELTARA